MSENGLSTRPTLLKYDAISLTELHAQMIIELK
jgi:hypothetical protein